GRSVAMVFECRSWSLHAALRVTRREPGFARFEIPIGSHGKLARAVLPEDGRHFAGFFFSAETGLLRPPNWSRTAVLPFDARWEDQNGVPHRHFLRRQVLSRLQHFAQLVIPWENFQSVPHRGRKLLGHQTRADSPFTVV